MQGGEGGDEDATTGRIVTKKKNRVGWGALFFSLLTSHQPGSATVIVLMVW
jgi:hypothetical protein